MSLESSIGDLVTKTTLLLDYFNGKKASIDAAVVSAIAAVPANKRILYVHQLNGLDTNDGGPLSPLKTIDKAIAITPVGGVCSIRLLSDYAIGSHITVEGTAVELRSDTIGTKRTIRPAYFKDGNGVTNLAGISFLLSAQIVARDMIIEFPSATGQVPVPSGGFNAFLKSNTTGTAPLLPVKLIDCEIADLPGATATLCSAAASGLILTVTGVIFPAGFAGRYVAAVAAGTTANTLSNIVTNLATL
ncbi:hypothetical protein HFK74_23230|uniref:hypothetical protein n=1 Tax=Pseudomonas sp. SbOxS1 TaxID=2723884 RepID=UPI0015D0FC07|nr:hypothetical protein [Pseudomonas sp. SbOxS1]NYU05618.1 hypothetical protein [Pseudomonas sp. SbOxS1]